MLRDVRVGQQCIESCWRLGVNRAGRSQLATPRARHAGHVVGLVESHRDHAVRQPHGQSLGTGTAAAASIPGNPLWAAGYRLAQQAPPDVDETLDGEEITQREERWQSCARAGH